MTVVGRVASGAEIIAGGRSILWRVARPGVRRVAGSTEARIFCSEARAELICIGERLLTAETMDLRMQGRSIEVRPVEDELKLRIRD